MVRASRKGELMPTLGGGRRTLTSVPTQSDRGLDAGPTAEGSGTPRRGQSHPTAWATTLVAVLVWIMSGGLPAADAQTLPQGFAESIVFSGLTLPTAVVFSNDGRVFVAEKSGVIKVFDSLSATTPTVFADLSAQVHDFWDRGLLGLALDPAFPTRPYVYVLYTYNAEIGGTAPLWPSQGCPNPPGATGDGCVVSARLSQLQAAGSVMTGSEKVLIEDWCQQYPSHSIGSLAFGGDGALYVSGGDGASFTFTDYGQDGNPLNPCGDPPAGAGGVQQPPTAEGGALRSQSLLRVAGGPALLGGAILRVDPDSGAGMLDNPLAGSSDPNARRIIAHGFRNPFRITLRPGTDEIWVGDVGWTDWEEINRFSLSTSQIPNFGWPCYEGSGAQPGYSALGLGICNQLYNTPGSVISPHFTYNHTAQIVPGEPCPPGSSSITGLAFYTGGNYPAEYNGALFFADYSRNCIWVMFNPTAFVSPALALGLNEGTGTTTADASGFGHPGTLVGASWNTAGKYGASLSLDGSTGYVRVDNVPLPTADYTYEAWIRPSRVNVYQAIVEGGTGVIELSLDGTGHLIVFSHNELSLTSASVIPANAWTHVALTRSGSLLTVYVNGVPDLRTGTDPSALDHGGCPLLIGVDTGAAGCTVALNGFFQGQIDEVRVYSRALSPSEIQTDMATPIPGTPAPATGPTTIATFVGNAAAPVDLKIGPGGDLYYVDFSGGTIRRIRSTVGGINQPPTAVATATPTSGAAPLTVQFDGTRSSDPDPGDTIAAYAWDLTGTGLFTDSMSPQPQYTYNFGGTYTVRLRVTDNHGASSVSAPLVIRVGTSPTTFIDTPAASLTWKVSDVITFSGHATDGSGAALPASGLSWGVILHHCPSTCHTHPLQTFTGVANGSFPAPDHDYPSYLELVLTATDSTGLQDTKSVLINPQTVALTFQSDPLGLQLVVFSSSQTTPFTRTVIIGSDNSVSAPTPQVVGSTTYDWASWSDGGAQSHDIVAGAAPATYTATYTFTSPPPPLVLALGLNEGTGTTTADASGNGHPGTLVGASWNTAGQYGASLSLNGTSGYVRVDNAPLPTADYTYEAWIKPSRVNVYQAIVEGGTGVIELSLDQTGHLIVWSHSVLSLTSASVIPANAWTHVALTRAGSLLTAYVNGVADPRTGNDPSALDHGGCSMLIGVDTDGGLCAGNLNGFFQGQVDEVRVYNRALSPSEIQTDMATPIGPPSPPTAVTFQSTPPGLQLVAGGSTQTTPVSQTVPVGSTIAVSAPTPQVVGGTTYNWISWSDGGAQSHNIVAGTTPTTYTATYTGTVTAFPSSTVIETGTLNGGSAANLTADDNAYYAVNSTTSGTRTSSWYGVFPGVSRALTSLKVTYKGKNSVSCTQTVSIWTWTNSTWVVLSSASVGTTEVLLANLTPSGTLSNYVSGTSGSGDVRVRARCTVSNQNFVSSGDLMQIVYTTTP